MYVNGECEGVRLAFYTMKWRHLTAPQYGCYCTFETENIPFKTVYKKK